MTQGTRVERAPGVVASRDHNFVGDLDIAIILLSPERSLGRIPMTEAVCTAAGKLPLSVMLTMLDVAGSDPALASCHPDWTATQDLTLHSSAWVSEGPLVGDHRLLRLGKRMILVTAELYDAHGIEDLDEIRVELDRDANESHPRRLTPVAVGHVSFARLPRSAARGADEYVPASWVGRVREQRSGRPAEGTLHGRAGLRIIDPSRGIVEVGHGPYVANSIGTIGGAVQSLAIEAAAEAIRPGLMATDAQIHFLSQVRAGPARTRATVVRDAPDHSVVSVELLDAGAGDQLGAFGTLILQRPPG